MIDSVSWSVGRSVACVARVSKLNFLAPRGIGQTEQNWRAGGRGGGGGKKGEGNACGQTPRF